MRPIRRILVAVKDPAQRSQPAVAKAAQLARAFGARLELFHALSAPLYVDAYAFSNVSVKDVQRELRGRTAGQLGKLAARLQRLGIDVTVSAEWDFPAHEAIVRQANRIKADLIVAERHAGRRFAAWLLHLTDWELLRASAIPVLIVKNGRKYKRPVVLSAVDPTHSFAKPAKLDQEILQAGSAFASALRGQLHAMHAYVPMPIGTPAPAGDARTAERIEAEAAANAATTLERALGRIRIPPARRHVVGRHPVDAIPDTAREIGSAIVVMGAISRSGLKRIFIGNTAERVLDQLSCDVLVVKPARFPGHVARGRRGARLTATSPLPLHG